MSFFSWHTYGYGCCISDLVIGSSERVRQLVHLAPMYEEELTTYFSGIGVKNPSLEDYENIDSDCGAYGITSILQAVIAECESIQLTACDDFEDNKYLLYEPSYPWDLPEYERSLTPGQIAEILQRYLSVITDDKPSFDFCNPENGG